MKFAKFLSTAFFTEHLVCLVCAYLIQVSYLASGFKLEIKETIEIIEAVSINTQITLNGLIKAVVEES